ncbi:predicted protein [Nematostella vectensis]|uniref:EGF-like domain-containing protein n=1 Tax=Nematostella vectensis TaxID=45351 RepID=A7SKW1_NEMVE|nr:predicted protein [Nematostella vectensis]|eukprot:XP_001627748.1 predicted protein [Nematostella vectensis]
MYLLIVPFLLMACSSNGEKHKPMDNDGGEFSFVNFNEHLNYFLAVQALAKTMELDVATCWLKCMDEFPACLSINSGKKASADPSFKICKYEERVIEKPPTPNSPNPCDKLKCSNGGKCRANYVNNTGECQFPLGFIGDTCDTSNLTLIRKVATQGRAPDPGDFPWKFRLEWDVWVHTGRAARHTLRPVHGEHLEGCHRHEG